jgi:hypothetical protein
MAGTAVAPSGLFVTGLRTPRGQVVRLGEGAQRVTIRVQFEALWDAFVVDASTDASISSLVTAALKRFGLGDALPADFMVKLKGWEVKGAEATVGSSGGKDGSTFLVQHRFRRPIR